MNLPKIPTDNLYKFYAVFGLVLIVLGIYLVYDTNLEILKQREVLLESANDYVNKTFDSDSTSVSVVMDGIRGTLEEHQALRDMPRMNTLIIYLKIFLTIGVLLSFSGFYMWYHRTQKFADQILKNEALKISYENEYALYKNIWSCIIDLRNSTLQLRPFLDYRDKTKSDKEIKTERLTAYYETYDLAANAIEKNKPFFPKSVYDSVYEAVKLSRFEAIDYEHEDDDRNKAKEQIESILEHLDKICELIRLRLDEVKVK